MNKKKIGLIVGALALAVAGTVTGLEVSSSPPPTKQTVGLCATCVTFPPTFNGAAITTGTFTPGGGTTQGTCLNADGSVTPNSGKAMTAFLASLSPGTEVDFNPNATPNLCYVVMLKGDENEGQGLYAPKTNNITLNGQGATLFFNSNAAAKPCNGSCQLAAVITANGANLRPQPNGLHIENFNIVGVDVTGQVGDGAGADFNSGVLIQGLTNVNVTNVSVSHVFGDCLTIQNAQGNSSPVDQGLVVNQFSGTACGRQGISPVSLNNALFNSINIGSIPTGHAAWDFEADSPGFGATNVVIKNCTFNGVVNIAGGGASFGPITMSNCVDGGAQNSNGTAGGANSTAVQTTNSNGVRYAGRFLFSNDHFRCGAGPGPCFDIGTVHLFPGSSPACQSAPAGCLAYADVQVHSSVVCTGNSGTSNYAVYRVANDSSGQFIADTIQGYYNPLGVVAADGSTATVLGGTQTGGPSGPFGTACTTGWPFKTSNGSRIP